MQLAISNIINVSVSEVPTGLNNYNTSNVALFSSDTPGESFPEDGYAIYLDPSGVATDFGTGSVTYKMALAIFSQQPNILANSGYLVVIPFESSETLDAAITRTAGLVQYFGVQSTQIESQTDMLAAAAVIQTLNKIAFFVQRLEASVESGGSLDLLTTGSFTQSRGLYYGSSDDLSALIYQASYVGRGLSVNFSGSNTTLDMNLKSLAGVQPDPTMTQTIQTKAKAAGADTYVSLQGVSAILGSGANRFFDQVYNQQWFVGAIQVAGFNYLRQTSTKVPQTENGIDGLKGAYRQVCQQSATNLYVAPGVWNSPTTFGNQQDLINNIAQLGYYIYSVPIAQQSETDRISRAAPLIQIALKEAGSVDSSTVIININP